MKRIIATAIFITAVSAPAFAESPVDRQMHSWDYVQQVGAAATQPQPEAPVMERHEQHEYTHHEGKSHEGKGKHHHGKHHHEHAASKPHHHHHHHKDEKAKEAPKEQPKQ